jgi:hypothetical protein
MAFGLRRKLTTRVIFPFLFGIFVMAGFDTWYLYTYLEVLLDDLIDSLKEDQLEIQLDRAEFISGKTGFLLQNPVNYMLISHATSSSLYSGTLNVNSSFTGYKNYESGPVYDDVKNYNLAVWYIDPEITEYDSLDAQSQDNLYKASVLDSLHTSIVKLDENYNVFIGFNYEGMIYLLPAQSICNFKIRDKCAKFETKKRPWWYNEATYNTDPDGITLIDPYLSASNDSKGIIIQTACHTIWDGDTLISVSCIDFLVNEIFANDYYGDAYHYILDTDYNVYYHPDFDASKDTTIYSIEYYEFEETDSSYKQEETDYYTSNILPKFKETEASLGSYDKQGERMLISVNPINLRLNLEDSNSEHYLSLAIVVEEDKVTAVFNDLYDDLIDLLIPTCVLLAALAFGVVVIGYV